MKRYIITGILLLSWICGFAQTTRTYTITFEKSNFSITHSEYGDEITSDEYDIILKEDTLSPAIPYVYINILLPDGEELSDFAYSAESSEATSQITLRSVPSLVETSSSSVNTTTSIRYPIQNYPASVELEEVSIMDGYHIACFIVSPVSYDATEQKINWIEKVNLSITTLPMVSSTDDTGYTHTGNMNKCLQQILHNPEELGNVPLSLATEEVSEDESIDYVIITSELLKESFQPLANWKKTKGVRTEIVTTNYIYTNYTGNSNQLKIKKFLNDYYQNRHLKYVLLGGDDNIIPTQGCYGQVNTSNGTRTDYTIPTDLFYSCFEKTFNWDADGDGIVGEPSDDMDLSPEIYHARIPVNDTIGVNVFVDRIINYEKVTTDTNHYLNLLLTGVKLFRSKSNGQSDTEIKNDYMYDNYIRNYWESGNVTRFYDTATDFQNGAGYAVSATNLQEQLKSGFHFVNMETHGGQTLWSMESGISYYTSKATSLENEYPMIITTSACITNAFDASSNNSYKTDPCLSEAFVRNPNSGILAYLGSSRYGWGYADTIASSLGPSLKLNALFYRELFNGTTNHYAEVVAIAKKLFGYNGMVYRWLQYSVNPIGDPEMPIFTNNPETINDMTYSWNESTLQIDAGISGCTITLSGHETDSMEYFQTNKETQFASFSNLRNGNYTLCITKPHYKPYLAEVIIGTEFIQNKSITSNVLYLVNNLHIGRNVTSSVSAGDVVIQSGSSVTIEATGEVTLDKGVSCEKGAILHIK